MCHHHSEPMVLAAVRLGYAVNMSLVIDEIYLPATLTSPPMTDGEFIEFCKQFPDCSIEMSNEGEILIRPPGDFLTSAQVGEIFGQLREWSRANGGGWVIESSGGFVLPNGARRAPDVAWFPTDKPGIPDRKKRPRFPRFAPDFVVELRSPDDSLSRLQPKMREWIENGTSLAWLVDPGRRAVEIYRPGRDPETVLNADSIAGEGPVKGFILDLRAVWDPATR
jgi:Uma2 family endonuclease